MYRRLWQQAMIGLARSDRVKQFMQTSRATSALRHRYVAGESPDDAVMLSRAARQRGFYPSIATHDTRLHEHALTTARANGWRPGEYEFEMLLGVREDVARALAGAGERVRLYLPFGVDWWPHAARRIGENPGNAILLARSMFG